MGQRDLLASLSMVYSRLLPSTDASIHFSKKPTVNHLEKHQASLLVQNLLVCGVLFLLVQPLGLKMEQVGTSTISDATEN